MYKVLFQVTRTIWWEWKSAIKKDMNKRMEKNTPTVIKCSDHLATDQLEPKAAEDFFIWICVPGNPSIGTDSRTASKIRRRPPVRSYSDSRRESGTMVSIEDAARCDAGAAVADDGRHTWFASMLDLFDLVYSIEEREKKKKKRE